MSEKPWTTLWIAFVGLMMLAIPAGGRAETLTGANVTADANAVTLTLTFDGAFDAPSSFALTSPDRLVIDVPGAEAGQATYPGAGAVQQVRTAQFDAATARIVLDLAEPAQITGSAANGRTLTVTLAAGPAVDFARLAARGRTKLDGPKAAPLAAKSAPAPETAVIAAAPPPPPAPAPKPKPAPAPDRNAQTAAAAPAAATVPRGERRAPQRRVQTGLPVVVIDPGHGGRDPGSPSVNGKQEKDAVLAIAKAIKRELDASGRVRTILTRNDDRYIPHRQRTNVARRNNAQLFISVHADSFPQKPEVSGATIYTLSETASDQEAARLAQRENRAGLISGVDLETENDDVTSILIDLAQRETMNNSAEFAAILQREMVATGVPFRSHFHRFAGFLVLKAPDVPAVLLETGYMSNEKDSKYLFSEKGQREIAQGVRRAVEAHFLKKLAQR
ncbi:N-acetylmuramoyl-L-alanine amidase [Pacificimonas sp. WHA3]|uniref:N-acetylmuramoyl-L-alanine amidase n=1 Tax=Pacificimonas pallii TaxID=2827236 RepID=A0ABS6SB26_9SPHN|nr:N-acetylmuramoyl-L-alanine amidase [Pacificimonas pallii]MBV7255550.1 N-acetylmuramoyl-L-alanine amidase [Pacificimonas pallii]